MLRIRQDHHYYCRNYKEVNRLEKEQIIVVDSKKEVIAIIKNTEVIEKEGYSVLFKPSTQEFIDIGGKIFLKD